MIKALYAVVSNECEPPCDLNPLTLDDLGSSVEHTHIFYTGSFHTPVI